MVDPNNPPSDDDDLLKDLDGESMNGGGAPDTSRPLPKKVELDIDDFLEEEIEEEPPPPPEQAPPPVLDEPDIEKPPEEASHKRFSKPKLILIGSMGFVLLAVLGLTAFFLLQKKEPPPSEIKPVITSVDLKPFMVNFPPPGDLLILNLTLSIKFPDAMTLQDFLNNRLRQRDRIYRMVQALGPTVTAAWKAVNERRSLEIELSNVRKDEPMRRKEISNRLKDAGMVAKNQQAAMKEALQREITKIVNETLRTGQVEKLDIIRMDMV